MAPSELRRPIVRTRSANAVMPGHGSCCSSAVLVVAVATSLASGTPAAGWIADASSGSAFDTAVNASGPQLTLRARADPNAKAIPISGAWDSWVNSPANTSWIPGAQTLSAVETSVSFSGSPLTLVANADAYADAIAESWAVTLATTVRATQETLGLPLTSSNGLSLYWGNANTVQAVTAAPEIGFGGTLEPGQPLVVFDSSHRSAAATIAAEPWFARAGNISQGVLDGVILGSPGAAQMDVVWNVDQFDLTSIPAGARTYISDKVQLLEVTATGTEMIGEVGFVVWLEDGKATLQFLDNFGSSRFEAQVGEQLLLTPGQLAAASLPLPQRVDPLALRVVNTHTEMSVVAAPRATIPVLAGAGYLPLTGLPPPQETPRIYWDPETGSLDFDPIPIVWSEGVLTPASDDPLFGGQLEITGLRWVGGTDRRFYFAGGTLTVTDRFGRPVATASLPALVFEDSLFGYQGLNGFAPILQTLEFQTGGSDWLEGFIDLMTLTAPYLPELFLGFDNLLLEDDLWSRPFNAPVTGFLSFSGAAPGLNLSVAPLPATAAMVALGLAILLLGRRAQKGRDPDMSHLVFIRGGTPPSQKT